MCRRLIGVLAFVLILPPLSAGCKRKSKNENNTPATTAAAVATPSKTPAEVVRVEQLVRIDLIGDTPSMAWSPNSEKVVVSADWKYPGDEDSTDEEGNVIEDGLGLFVIDAYDKSSKHVYHKAAQHPVWLNDMQLAFLPGQDSEGGVLTLHVKSGKAERVVKAWVQNLLPGGKNSVYAYRWDGSDGLEQLHHRHDECESEEPEEYDGYHEHGEYGEYHDGYPEDYEGYEEGEEEGGPWYRIDLDGGDVEALTGGKSDNSWTKGPNDYNPQCRQAAVIDGETLELKPHAKGSRIIKGGQEVKVTFTPYRIEEERVEGCLSHDGRYVAFVTPKGEGFTLQVYNLEGFHPVPVATPAKTGAVSAVSAAESTTPTATPSPTPKPKPKKIALDKPFELRLLGDTPSVAWHTSTHKLVVNAAFADGNDTRSHKEKKKLGAYVVNATKGQAVQIYEGPVYHPVWASNEVAWGVSMWTGENSGVFVKKPSDPNPRWVLRHEDLYSVQPDPDGDGVIAYLYAPYEAQPSEDHFEEMAHSSGWFEMALNIDTPSFALYLPDLEGLGQTAIPDAFGHPQCRQTFGNTRIVYDEDAVRVSILGQTHDVTKTAAGLLDTYCEDEQEEEEGYEGYESYEGYDGPGEEMVSYREEPWGCRVAACLSDDGRLISVITGKPGKYTVSVHSLYGRATTDTSGNPNILGP